VPPYSASTKRLDLILFLMNDLANESFSITCGLNSAAYLFWRRIIERMSESHISFDTSSSGLCTNQVGNPSCEIDLNLLNPNRQPSS
jgi:hypothetical protein